MVGAVRVCLLSLVRRWDCTLYRLEMYGVLVNDETRTPHSTVSGMKIL